MRVREIDIGEGKRAGSLVRDVVDFVGRIVDGLGDGTRLGGGGDCRHVVRTRDSHAHGARHAATVAVQNVEREGLDLGVGRAQVFHRRCRNAIAPGDHTTRTAARCVRGDARSQAAQRT